MFKVVAMGLSSLFGVGLAGLFQEPRPPVGSPPPPPKAKAKAKGEELRKTYDLLRRVRSDSGGGRQEERIADWTERATELYRKAVRTRTRGDIYRSRELGTAAHDLARAIDHARNAARIDRQDTDLPAPPDEGGPGNADDRTRHDLFRAYERIRSSGNYAPDVDAKYYLDAAKDLYNAARRDVEAGRDERGGELARAAEAMTHVPEHLSNAAETGGPEPRGPESRGPEAKKKGRIDEDFGGPLEPKKSRDEPRGRDLPPVID